MNSEVELAIKEYYDVNEKIKQLEKRKSEYYIQYLIPRKLMNLKRRIYFSIV